MTATKTTPAPSTYSSGFCQQSRHDRCRGVFPGATCGCPCHTEPEPEPELEPVHLLRTEPEGPRPRLLDLFCGAGGAARGYQLAGFHVTGVDIAPQPNYCGDVFFQGDALDFIAERWREFDAIHASPPCQASSALTKGTNAGREYPQLIPETRRLLRATGLPTVIENVQGSDLRRDLTLCGEMFGLAVIRHRFFELDRWTMPHPEHLEHRGRVAGWRHGEWFDGPYFAVYGDGGGKGTVAQWQQAMGMDWTDVRLEIAEAIPPAYSQFIGEQLYRVVTADALDVAA